MKQILDAVKDKGKEAVVVAAVAAMGLLGLVLFGVLATSVIGFFIFVAALYWFTLPAIAFALVWYLGYDKDTALIVAMVVWVVSALRPRAESTTLITIEQENEHGEGQEERQIQSKRQSKSYKKARRQYQWED